LAYGPLTLQPNEFWALTFHELMLLVKGLQSRQARLRERDAWLLANLLQPHSKQTLKPKMFLGEGSGSGSGGWEKITQEEYDALMAKKQRAKNGATG
jgi:hypothetical protein